MCVAIVKPVGTCVTDEILKRCWDKNNDGCGFAFIEEGKRGKRRIMVSKSLKFEPFLEEFRKAEEQWGSKSPFLIHFRMKSKGEVSIDNCHPFVVDSEHVFIHNGTFCNVPVDTTNKKSDTQMFNEHILRRLPAGWFGNPAVKALIAEFVGYSKVAIMDVTGKYEIVNEGKGEWFGGVWYSNDQYKPEKKYNEYFGGNHSRSRYDYMDEGSNYKDETGADKSYFCSKAQAYHGEVRWSNKSHLYQKYDYFKNKWTSMDVWQTDNDKRLKRKNTPIKTDDQEVVMIVDGELSQAAIEELAEDLNIDDKEQEFTIRIKNLQDVLVPYQFKRCDFCWTADYTKNLINIFIDDAEQDLCEECAHNMKTHGFLDTGDVN